MRALARLWRELRQFRAAEAGVAAVEFALIVPIMLLLYIGSNEASVMISMDRKVQFISGTVGDLVARSEGAITTGTITDYVKVASGLVSPFAAPDMVQIVTQVEVLANGTTKVDWSKGYKNQVATTTLNRVKGATYPLPTAVTDIARGQFVIVAETSLPYTPLYGIVYNVPVNLYRENFYLPRFGEQIVLD